MKTKRGPTWALWVSSLGALAFFAGCSNSYLGASPQSSALTGNEHAALWSDPMDAFKCPTTENVTPVYPSVDGFAGRYSVCTSKTNASAFSITGVTERTDEICVVPLKIVNGLLYRYPGPAGNTSLLHTCTRLESDGTSVSFSGVSVNAVFITEKAYYPQLEQCLLSGNALNCPGASTNTTGYYSYGQTL